MSTPAYITNENVYYSDTTTPAALLLTDDTNWVLPYCNLVTEVGRTDLDTLVKVNGGTLPLKSEDVAHSVTLDNGKTWYDTYVGATRYVDIAHLPTYNAAHGGGGGGGGGSDYVLPAATKTTLGGVRATGTSGVGIDSSGYISVNMTELPPAGSFGQVLTSQGSDNSPVWLDAEENEMDIDGGEF